MAIWKESRSSPLPHDARHAPRHEAALLGKGVRGPLLVGLITVDRPVRAPDGTLERNSYNSATVVMPDGSMQTPADKLQLLWFGETVPGGALSPIFSAT